MMAALSARVNLSRSQVLWLRLSTSYLDKTLGPIRSREQNASVSIVFPGQGRGVVVLVVVVIVWLL